MHIPQAFYRDFELFPFLCEYGKNYFITAGSASFKKVSVKALGADAAYVILTSEDLLVAAVIGSMWA